MAVYIRRKPLLLLNCKQIKDYIITANLANMLPMRRFLNNELFIFFYEKMVKKIIPRINVKRYLKINTNKTFNIRKKRVQNLCFVIENQEIYYLYSNTINNHNKSING